MSVNCKFLVVAFCWSRIQKIEAHHYNKLNNLWDLLREAHTNSWLILESKQKTSKWKLLMAYYALYQANPIFYKLKSHSVVTDFFLKIFYYNVRWWILWFSKTSSLQGLGKKLVHLDINIILNTVEHLIREIVVTQDHHHKHHLHYTV